jgi:hypothetical protein
MAVMTITSSGLVENRCTTVSGFLCFLGVVAGVVGHFKEKRMWCVNDRERERARKGKERKRGEQRYILQAGKTRVMVINI